ncbi:hypothetical protein CAS74_004887 [Pichia kudriavzevii]|uniref:Prefoldin subunit 1 n=1 Tax=Pichia kudriavzevii TaxID=4909 RepID=A0A099P8V5_PICKU|nr:uncharacterized protein C5L36_0A12310 [Pichia kudriavzevii]AWU74655.1 hypothetical protein C5L36_0A12310 [Pichia kudriavzevii]KGK40679.1 hypothetical protein JL09_g205 [Pichia kudriavzevii]OUT20145.1 hypothetical protein CAS74_004887 [Pichia kudriavzevii]
MADVNSMIGEMRAQLSQHQTELHRTIAAIERVTRSNTVVEKSVADIRSTGKDCVWQAVGRTFVKTPLEEYEMLMKNQIRENIDTMNTLNKKKHYLETSIKNTIESLKQVTLGA